MATFAEALQENLEADPDLSRRGKRLLAVLKEQPRGRFAARRKANRIARMEKSSRVALKLSASGLVDWADVSAAGDIDWKAVIMMLFEFLMKLLPLIFLTEPEDEP